MIYKGQTEKKIFDIINNTLLSIGYEVVRIRIYGSANNKTLQIMIERNDEILITVEDCEKVSHQIIPSMIAHGINTGSYNIEVSSPGLDRPLTRPKDFQKNISKKIKVKTLRKIRGSASFTGVLDHFDDSKMIIGLSLIAPLQNNGEEIKEVVIELDNINEANLI